MGYFLLNLSGLTISIFVVPLILFLILKIFKKFYLIQSLIKIYLISLILSHLTVYVSVLLYEIFNLAEDALSALYTNIKHYLANDSKYKYLLIIHEASFSFLFFFFIFLERNTFRAYTEQKHDAPDTSEIITIERVGRDG